MAKTYDEKRRFDETPEPPARFGGDVDPASATPGESFVIHQHYATRLHFDLRLEMLNGRTPVLVSWAVPKGLPVKKGERHLAIHVEDHPFEYGSFSGKIPSGNYGAGEVRIFDSGTYELLMQEEGKLTFRLEGGRLRGSFTMVRTKPNASGKEQWLVFLKEDERDPAQSTLLKPMLATLIDEPFDDDAWAFEPKWDGVRALAVCDDATRLISRNDKDITVAYPELHSLHLQTVAIDTVLDGELVAFEGARPSFQRLQSRMHVRDTREIERLRQQIPVVYMAFDILSLDGRNVTRLPWDERRALLEQTVVEAKTIQLSPFIRRDGRALYEAAKQQQLEGIVGKRRHSIYEPARRSKHWVKVKMIFEADLVVAGWSEGNRAGILGSLVLGAYDGDALRYVGNVGTGFTDKTRALVQTRLEGLAADSSPFGVELKGRPALRHAHWVDPSVVTVVEFRELTSAGKLRAPAFKGLRDDKRAEECTFEELKTAAGQSS